VLSFPDLIGESREINVKPGFPIKTFGNDEKAIPRFEKATELEPEYSKAYLYLGRSYLNLSKWIEAVPPLRTAYSLSPNETKKEMVNILLDALIGGALAEEDRSIFKELQGN